MIAALDREHIDLVLNTQRIGRLACSEDGQAYVVPISYVYEDGYVYGHANEGQKVRMMRKNPKVCFEVDQIRDPTSWRSVVALGTFEELSSEAAVKALDLIFSRLSPLQTSETTGIGTNPRESVVHDIRLKSTKGVTFRIHLSETSGRYEHH